MKLGVQVGLGPGHIVLGGDPAPPPLKGEGELGRNRYWPKIGGCAPLGEGELGQGRGLPACQVSS